MFLIRDALNCRVLSNMDVQSNTVPAGYGTSISKQAFSEISPDGGNVVIHWSRKCLLLEIFCCTARLSPTQILICVMITCTSLQFTIALITHYDADIACIPFLPTVLFP